MTNDWSKQDFIQGLYFEVVPYNKSINMFERMDIVGYIYEVVVEISKNKFTRSDANCYGIRRTVKLKYA